MSKICNACGDGELHLRGEYRNIRGCNVVVKYYLCDHCGSELADQELMEENLEAARVYAFAYNLNHQRWPNDY